METVKLLPFDHAFKAVGPQFSLENNSRFTRKRDILNDRALCEHGDISPQL